MSNPAAYNKWLAFRRRQAAAPGFAKHQSGVRFALERPLWCFAHPNFAALQNLRFRSFGQQKRRQFRTLDDILI